MNTTAQITISGGRASQLFKRKVVDYLKIKEDLKVSEADFDVSNFRNGELNIRLLDSVRGCHSVIFQQFTQSRVNIHEELFELFLLEDTINRSAADSITLCLPFIPYLRQDTKAEGREPISAKTLLDLLNCASSGKLVRITTYDMHNPAEQGFINLPIDNLPAMPLFSSYFKNQSWFDKMNTVVLAPDVGGAKRAEEFASCLGLSDSISIMHKKRKKGQLAEAKTLIGDVSNKNVIIIDDIIDSGGTILASAEVLRKNGARRISVAATHGIFSEDAINNFSKSDIDVVITDSIPRGSNFINNNGWLTVLSLAEYTSEVIYANAINGSVSRVISEAHKMLPLKTVM